MVGRGNEIGRAADLAMARALFEYGHSMSRTNTFGRDRTSLKRSTVVEEATARPVKSGRRRANSPFLIANWSTHMTTRFPSVMTLTRVSLWALLAVPLAAQTTDRLMGKNVLISQTNYKGRNAIQVIATPGAANATSYAVIKEVLFRDGTIEVDLAGQPSAGAGAEARGFIGIAFRLQGDGRYEYIYLRPTNGRADDQIRRNHSTQYSSHPNFDFARSRQEAPEKYESYVDLQPGVWTRYKIEVEGRKARLYVHGAEQPCLIVNDLKLEPAEGGVALWVGPGTEGYFSNLKVTAK
jgi:hypothetical protein